MAQRFTIQQPASNQGNLGAAAGQCNTQALEAQIAALKQAATTDAADLQAANDQTTQCNTAKVSAEASVANLLDFAKAPTNIVYPEAAINGLKASACDGTDIKSDFDNSEYSFVDFTKLCQTEITGDVNLVEFFVS